MATERARTHSGATQLSDRFSTFYVDEMFFGIDVLRVQEVLHHQPMTRVPKAPEVIEGLMNLRGQIVMAIDMRRLLLLPKRASGSPPMNVVIRTDAGAMSLLVDEIGDVLELEETAFEPPPVNLEASARKLIRGVFKLEEKLLLVLDPERTIESAIG
ncbi:chemotaxis protein CheW [Acidobacteria bacterium AB60]|nr:chemotaxis protein CheW [Acidobacteria bacterium AB60]